MSVAIMAPVVVDVVEQKTNQVQIPQLKEKKQKQKKPKQQPSQGNGQKLKPKADNRPLYRTLGEQLLSLTTPESMVKSLPPLNIASIPLPPMPAEPASPLLPSPMSEKKNSFFSSYEILPKSKSTISLSLPRRSMDSTLSGSTKIVRDEQNPSTKYKVKGAIYTLNDFSAMNQTESLIQRYGRVAHMGVRDPSYSFWMNRTRTAVIHFKVLNKVAVLGGDPLCHPDRLALSMAEFENYCKSVGWKTAVVGASESMLSVAKTRGWTTMRFGTETILNPQTNEVLLGKAGKRIVVQCKQLLDPARGGLTVHAYCPSLGRDAELESDLRTLYDDWRNARNTSRDSQAFITVFDLFAMHNLMTFLYTKDKTGKINGFSALRQLGLDVNAGYHIDPFIQSADAPRGVSDLLIYASLSFLNAKGCTYLSLGFEPLAVVGEISGLPSAFHSTTRKVYKHVFGRIPVGGKEAFHARWKPDAEQEPPVFLLFVGKIPSPRFMLAMMHYTNISLRSIIKQDLEELGLRGKKDKKSDGNSSATDESSQECEQVTIVHEKGKAKVIETVVRLK